MEKEIYEQPTMQVVELELQGVIADSATLPGGQEG